jgi:phosphatidylinositol N-acetylglucosaminyltransferase subunit P
MPPQSRGVPVPAGFQSKSTPNLPTLSSLDTYSHPLSPADPVPLTSTAAVAPSLETFPKTHDPNQSPPITSPSEPASIEDNNEENDLFTLDVSSTSSEDDDLQSPQHQRPLLGASRSYTSLPQFSHPTNLFPPFYNRPPTPLPPSPSLTSLLRPPFSTHPSSRPTTPESSDVEYNSTATTTTNGANPNAALSKSARVAPVSVPRASPKVPTYEYYGFALYLASSAAFMMYVLWAYLPSPFLHQLGVHYYPNRWWALAIPAWLVMLVLYIYVALASYNTQYLTLPMRSCENLVDEAGMIAIVDTKTRKIVKKAGGILDAKSIASTPTGKKKSEPTKLSTTFEVGEDVNWKDLWSISTDGVMDVPIGAVCEILYGEGRDVDEVNK